MLLAYAGRVVDLRILQANERTLLAWVRTSAGLMAFGFVVARFGLWLRWIRNVDGQTGGSIWFGIALVALGALTSLIAAGQYVRVRSAILRDRPIEPGRVLAPAVAISLAVIGLGLGAYLALRAA